MTLLLMVVSKRIRAAAVHFSKTPGGVRKRDRTLANQCQNVELSAPQRCYVASQSYSSHSLETDSSFRIQRQRRSINAARKPSLEQLLSEVPVGSMDRETWQHARGLIAKWAKRGNARRAQELLDRMVVEARHQQYLKVNTTLYNTCIDAWAKKGRPEEASSLLELMQSRHDESPSTCAAPDTISYNSVLDAWAASRDKDAARHAEKLIDTMERLAKDSPDGAVQPDTWSYNLVMLAYANRTGDYISAKAAEDWLLRLSELGMSQKLVLDTVSFNTVLKAWSSSGDPGGPERARQILQLMIKLYNDGHDNVRPDSISFSTVANAYAKQTSRESAERAFEVLQQGLELNLPGVNLTNCFNCVLQAWARSGAADAGTQAESLLRQAQTAAQEGSGVSIRPDEYSYTSCLDALAASGGARKAHAFLINMIKSHSEIDVSPNTVTFNRAIYAWVKSDEPDRVEQADGLLRLMDELASTKSFDSRPDVSTYNMCIDAWIISPSDHSARALALLERAEDDIDHDVLDNFAYNRVIKGLSLSRSTGAAAKALEVLERMEDKSKCPNYSLDVQPDAITYTIVLTSLAKTGQLKYAEKALDLLMRMESMYAKGIHSVEPSIMSYTSVMNAFVRSSDKARAVDIGLQLFDRILLLDRDKDRSLTLDTDAFRVMLLLLAESAGERPDAANHARRILKEMLEVQRLGNKTVRPDAGCYSACVIALAKSRGKASVTQAHDMLKDLVDKYDSGTLTELPTRRAFVAVIIGLARSGSVKACDSAQQVVTLMNDLTTENSKLEPDLFVYSILLKMLVKSGHDGAAEQADNVLNTMENKQQLGKWRMGPDRTLYNLVIGAWAKAKDPFKAQRARGVLDRIRANTSISADMMSYNSVLNSAAFTKGNDTENKEALRVALATFEEMKKTTATAPDHVTYGTMIKLCKHLMECGERRTYAVKSIFQESCKAGQVGRLVMKEMLSALPSHERMELERELKAYSPQRHKETLPSGWTGKLRRL